MAIHPDAIYKPITAAKGRKSLTLHNRVNLHVAVAETASLFGYFNQSGIPDSHFYVRKDGTFEQYVDTSMRANADLEGNDGTISIETQGGVKNANGEPWTSAQLDTLAKIYAWAVKTHGVALKLATDSQLGDTSKGLSYHRLGVDPWRKAGSMRYSTSRGKICPGDAKIRQIPGILTRAKAILGGAENVSSPVKPAKPASTPSAKPPVKPLTKKLDVDGALGKDTITRWQTVIGTPVDGSISTPSQLTARVQTILNAAGARDWDGKKLVVDGLGLHSNVGSATPKSRTMWALQVYLGTPRDGIASKDDSQVYRALQSRLNAGKF